MPQMTAEEYEAQKKQEVNLLLLEANANPSYTLTCRNCKHKVIYVEYVKALAKGHIYSDAGRKEFGITQFCEFCFDEFTMIEEEEDGDD